MKKVVFIVLILILAIVIGIPKQVNAVSESTKIEVSDNKITINGEAISTDSEQSVYLSTKMDNGGTSEKAQEANIEISNIVTITKAGTYEFSGKLTDGQIAIDGNKVNGEVIIILNNVEVTCKNAPAIIAYCKTIENENCKVTIKTAQNSENKITGSKLKTSVEEWEDQDKLSYYIDKGYSDEQEYYERYKYDGAISSDVKLTFEGEGTLNIVSTKKEGIECKMDIIINSGTININSQDDGINACTDNKSNVEINGGTVIVNIDPTTDEGDGIDSNGKLTINGGTVYAFACPGSDNGLDADQGVYINGGTVFSTGSMQEEFKSSNNKKIVQLSFSTEINEGDSIVIVDNSGKAVFAYKADRKISTIGYSSEDLDDQEYSVYTGTNISGQTNNYGIYTKIDTFSLDNLTKQENSGNGMMMGGPGEFNREFDRDFQGNMQQKSNSYFIIVLGVLSGMLVLVILITLISSKKKERKTQ